MSDQAACDACDGTGLKDGKPCPWCRKGRLGRGVAPSIQEAVERVLRRFQREEDYRRTDALILEGRK
jgi:hypothetical protein